MVFDTVKLGEITRTGGICPCGGWWVCVESGQVVTARFDRGQRVPPAVLRTRRNLWQWLTRQPRRVEIATVWTLAEYDEQQTLPMVTEALAA
jgi:hypothetical protein